MEKQQRRGKSSGEKIVKHRDGKGGDGSRAGFEARMDRDERRELSPSPGTEQRALERTRLYFNSHTLNERGAIKEPAG